MSGRPPNGCSMRCEPFPKAPRPTPAPKHSARQVATGLIDDIDAVRWPTDSEVMWVDGPASNPGLRSTPIAVDSLLSENLWAKRAGVLTSATLPPKATSRLGLPDDTATLDVGSPFDYQNNALLYCPTHLLILGTGVPQRPTRRDRNPDGSGWRTHACAVHVVLGDARSSRTTRGRLLEDSDAGRRGQNALLRDFVEDEETSLFATMSFWQGVDAPGRTCSLVIIDRIPFPRPNEPVLQARRDRAGKAAFGTIDLPRAATLLAQGAGRLIRSSTDRGVVAVLDPRLATARSYRWELITALPPMTRTKDRDDVTRFLQELRDDEVGQ